MPINDESILVGPRFSCRLIIGLGRKPCKAKAGPQITQIEIETATLIFGLLRCRLVAQTLNVAF
jgi:hypothetical protein